MEEKQAGAYEERSNKQGLKNTVADTDGEERGQQGCKYTSFLSNGAVKVLHG